MFNLAEHPFVVASLIVLLSAGRLRSLKHPRHGLGITLDESPRLLHVLFADGLRDFWIRRTGKAERKQNRADREDVFKRKRLMTSLWRFTPEPRPLHARTVEPASKRISVGELQGLIRAGFPASGFVAFLPSPSVPVTPDRRSLKNFRERHDDCNELGQGSLASPYSAHVMSHPEHPYVPAAPVRRTTQSESRLSEKEFGRRIQALRCGLPMQAALREIVLLGLRPVDVATKRGISLARLKKAASRLRHPEKVPYKISPMFSNEVSPLCNTGESHSKVAVC